MQGKAVKLPQAQQAQRVSTEDVVTAQPQPHLMFYYTPESPVTRHTALGSSALPLWLLLK